MAKVERTGAAPVSKYAAKKFARVRFNEEEETSVAKEVDTINPRGANPDSEFKGTPDSAYDKNRGNYRKGNVMKKREIPNTAYSYPEHFVQLALLIKNNAEIRRFTSLGILNYLYQKGEIKGADGFVSFKWNKFAVKYKGLMREYSYNEPFFLNALVASFVSFSASAQRTIDKFCKTELMVGINKAIDSEEVDEIVEANQKHQDDKASMPVNDGVDDDAAPEVSEDSEE